MKNGRQKQNNITLIGTTNCGNSFLLDTLELIYKTFMNPSAIFYAWVGLEECKIAYLFDFRYTLEWIKWSNFLLLLEGQTVNLPRPENQFSSELRILRDNTDNSVLCNIKKPNRIYWQRRCAWWSRNWDDVFQMESVFL